MQKTILGIVALIVFGAVVAYYSYLDHNRFKVTTTTSHGIAYEVDTKTGESWMLAGATKVRQEDPKAFGKATEKTIELPHEALTMLHGTAAVSRINHIECAIYNGSNYEVTELYVRVVVKNEVGNDEIDRIYMMSPEYSSRGGLPFKNTNFETDLGFELNGREWSWRITKAIGSAHE